jgi:hypothetical protein
MSELVVTIARELYDHFVMGGWEPQDAYPLIESWLGWPTAYMCPRGCGCLWRDNKDGTMSLFGPNSRSCKDCETMPLGELLRLYERVTATKEQPEGAEWKPDSMQANAAPFLEKVGTCRTPHFLGEFTPDRKALIQTPHYELPLGLCKDWMPQP